MQFPLTYMTTPTRAANTRQQQLQTIAGRLQTTKTAVRISQIWRRYAVAVIYGIRTATVTAPTIQIRRKTNEIGKVQ